jgi:hypothetical protein
LLTWHQENDANESKNYTTCQNYRISEASSSYPLLRVPIQICDLAENRGTQAHLPDVPKNLLPKHANLQNKAKYYNILRGLYVPQYSQLSAIASCPLRTRYSA